MLSANEIRNVRFSKAMGGYKQDEVDVLLDKVEADYDQFERVIREMNGKITELKSELEESKNSQGNIQNILVSAQKFADQIVEEAKAKSAEIITAAQEHIEIITAQEKELTTAFDKKAGERKFAYQSDLDKIIETAEKKQTAVETATQDCIDRQQLLFKKLQTEIADFKAEIMAKYKEHLELLSQIPDTMPTDPVEAAKIASLSFDTMPTVQEYVQNPEEFVLTEDNAEEPVAEEIEIAEPNEPVKESAQPVETGFVINADDFDIDDEDIDE